MPSLEKKCAPAPITPCFVYMLCSLDQPQPRTYVGWTTDLSARLAAHNNSNGAKATRGRQWVIIFSDKFNTRSEAMRAEYALKTDRTRRKTLLNNYLKMLGKQNMSAHPLER